MVVTDVTTAFGGTVLPTVTQRWHPVDSPNTKAHRCQLHTVGKGTSSTDPVFFAEGFLMTVADVANTLEVLFFPVSLNVGTQLVVSARDILS